MASSHTSAITTSFSPFTEYRLSSRNGLSQQAHDKTQYSHRTSHHRQLDRPPLANRNGELRSAPPPAVKDTLNSQEHTSSVDLTAVRPSNGAPIPTDSCFCDGAPNPLRQTPEMRAAFVKKAIDEACVPSEDLAGKAPEVRGYDFNGGVDYAAIMRQMYTTGFQATHFGQAVRELNRM